ncbi:hypothetical protein [Myxosarcina sp. GI1]|uniref:hypothetical protein n=1 Tax=Myxosarcina sp. GI1 TaxID=1541065 RepID=UPI00209DC1A8|nr:hypothetical protein [Myxosarcina sp. GI1]
MANKASFTFSSTSSVSTGVKPRNSPASPTVYPDSSILFHFSEFIVITSTLTKLHHIPSISSDIYRSVRLEFYLSF